MLFKSNDTKSPKIYFNFRMEGNKIGKMPRGMTTFTRHCSLPSLSASYWYSTHKMSSNVLIFIRAEKELWLTNTWIHIAGEKTTYSMFNVRMSDPIDAIVGSRKVHGFLQGLPAHAYQESQAVLGLGTWKSNILHEYFHVKKKSLNLNICLTMEGEPRALYQRQATY
jgi:hypothetical protein